MLGGCAFINLRRKFQLLSAAGKVQVIGLGTEATSVDRCLRSVRQLPAHHWPRALGRDFWDLFLGSCGQWLWV